MIDIDSAEIQTANGGHFCFRGPFEFRIEDIAAALSKICRFTGHCKDFYSVAQHSVLVSEILPPELALEGLLHDAHEAYVGDMSTTLKRMIPEYKVIERAAETAMREFFDLPAKMSVEVKHADLVMLATEKRDLMPLPGEEWSVLEGITPRFVRCHPWTWQLAERMFLARYTQLQGLRS